MITEVDYVRFEGGNCSMFQIGKFTVESLTDRCVTDNGHPRFSWYYDSDRNGAKVDEAVLTVAPAEGKTSGGNKDTNPAAWSVKTDSQIAVPYAGQALKPFSIYTAKLEASDDAGEKAEAEVSFETGRMNTAWQAQWITDGTYSFTEKNVSPTPLTFRKALESAKKVVRARIYATALGIYNLYLDGDKVGEDYFAPGFTSYKNQLQYQTYDITAQLQGGRSLHTLTAVVGGGWAVGRFTYKSRNRIFADRQALLAEIRVDYADGTTDVIGTDVSWDVTREGNFRETEFYNGEVYDATVDMTKVHWVKAAPENVKLHPVITASYGVPVRAHEVFQPISVTKSPSGVLVYDLGQNFAGVIKAKIKNAKKGQKIVFTHAEVLMDGELYREPLRTAKQEAVYTCKDGDQTYQPSMTYMGFRYVGVEGIDEKDLELCGVALYSDIIKHGDFKCSNELINQLQSNINWGARSNFVDIPTDCPQRDERLGWTGDIALFGSTAVYNFEMTRFLEKWLKDVKSDQSSGGGIPMIVPFTALYWQWELVFTMAVDHWGDACILVPWASYLNTGDEGILKEMYPVMQKYIKACKFWAGLFSAGKSRYVWQLLHHYGDWVAPNSDMWTWMRRGKFTATASLSNTSQIMARIAGILGKADDVKKYTELHEKTADAYRSVLMDENCKVKSKENFQTGYVLPLHYNMVSGADREKTAKNLVELVRKEDYHIGTGFPGTPYVLFALADNGYVEDAFKMLLTDTCPSWLYEVKTGGTTIWERWDALREDGTCNTGGDDGTGGMVSFNHYASGAVGDFLYKRVAGIEALEGGYKTFKIAPLMGGGLTEAEGYVACAYGEIRSSWKLEDGKFSIDVKVPVGTTCELTLPSGKTQTLASGAYHFFE